MTGSIIKNAITKYSATSSSNQVMRLAVPKEALPAAIVSAACSATTIAKPPDQLHSYLQLYGRSAPTSLVQRKNANCRPEIREIATEIRTEIEHQQRDSKRLEHRLYFLTIRPWPYGESK